jgi:RNA polymerase primary sigma factor
MYAVAVSRRHAATDDDRSTLSAYLKEIATIPRLTIDEEQQLGACIRSNRDRRDEEALGAVRRLVEANLRFVVSYAKRYRGLGVPLLDLIHEGNLGLIEAAWRFDPRRNVKFISYAVWWVRESVLHVLAEQTRAFSFPPKLLGELGRAADVSLSAGARADGARALDETLESANVVPVDDELIHQADLHELAAAMLDLSRKEREIVRLRFGLQDDRPRTLQEIGNRLRLSRERVRQIESRAKEKLRRSARLRSHLN